MFFLNFLLYIFTIPYQPRFKGNFNEGSGMLLEGLPFSCSLQEKAVQEAVEKRSVRLLTATSH